RHAGQDWGLACTNGTCPAADCREAAVCADVLMTHFEAIAGQSSPTRVISIVGFVHGLSHLFMLVVPPIFLLLQDEFSVSLVELGVVLAAFNLVTTVTQYP